MIPFNEIPAAIADIKSSVERIEILLTAHQNPIPSDQKTIESPNFTLKEAAKYCRMPVPTFRLHLKKGYVIGSKPGKSWVFTNTDLDDFIKRFRVKKVDGDAYLVDQRKDK